MPALVKPIVPCLFSHFHVCRSITTFFSNEKGEKQRNGKKRETTVSIRKAEMVKKQYPSAKLKGAPDVAVSF